jgi:hypothetical protein
MVEVIQDGRVIAFLDDDTGDLCPVIAGGVWALIGVGVAAAIAGAAISAYSAVQGAKERQAAFKYNRDVATNQAQAARDAAGVAAQIRENEIRRILGAQSARLGASGIVPTEGSPLLVQMESAQQGALDLARIRYAGETQATSFTSQGILQGFYGSMARRAGNLQAGASIIGGIGSAAGMAGQAYGGMSQPSGNVQSQAP